jgi:hypothetical protein
MTLEHDYIGCGSRGAFYRMIEHVWYYISYYRPDVRLTALGQYAY